MSSRWPNKTIVGLTGNIATGKSTVMDLAARRGALTLDADQIVHEILDGDSAVQGAVDAAFDGKVRGSNGVIDRLALAAIVFQDAAALRTLERIVHPAVGAMIVQRIDGSDAQLVFVEAIKLLEGALVEMCDQIWVADCSRQRQIERLVICRGLDEVTAVMRVDAQNPQQEKVARADVVIDTNGALAATTEQFTLAWKRVLASTLEKSDATD